MGFMFESVTLSVKLHFKKLFAGLTLEIFQYLHEQYIISPEGFIAWEESELEPEGKGNSINKLFPFVRFHCQVAKKEHL